MVAHDNVGSKRHRRPSVKLADTTAVDHSSLPQRRPNKGSKNRHLSSNTQTLTLALVDSTNPNNSNVDDDDDDDDDDNNDNNNNNNANLDNVAIGSWKIRNFKSKKLGPTTKRVRCNWASKASGIEKDDKIVSTDIDDSENTESPVNAYDNNNKIDDNVNGRKRGTRVSEEGRTTDTEGRDWNCGSERNGVKVWLNQLGLGRYAALFEIHEVDDEVLPMLTLEDLKDMGINAVGSRRKMYCSIQKLNKGFS